MYNFLIILMLCSSVLGVSAQSVEDEKVPAKVYFNNGKLTFESCNKAFKLCLETDQSYARIGNCGELWQPLATPTKGTDNPTE